MNPFTTSVLLVVILIFSSTTLVVVAGGGSSNDGGDIKDTSGKIYYEDWKENIDVEPILKNDKLLTSYVKCFMSTGICNSDQRKVLKIVPELMETMFAKCTPKQKSMARTILRYVYNNRRNDFERLGDKFDPERKYYDRIIVFMNE